MTLEELLDNLDRRGIEIRANGDQLAFRAPAGALDDTLKSALRLHKAHLLTRLDHTGEPAHAALLPDPATRHAPFPLTPIQQAYLVGRSRALHHGGVAAHSYVELEHPTATLAQAEDALNTVIQRHDMLRVIIHADGTQRVLREVPRYAIDCIDLRNTDTAAVHALRSEMESQVRPTERWPLFEIRASLHPHALRLHVSIDLMTLDAWSCQLFFMEWFSLIDGATLPAPPALQCRDYLQYLHGEALAARRASAQAYWDTRLPTLPAAPQLPAGRHHVASTRFTRLRGEIEAADWLRFKAHCRTHRVTPSTALATLFANVLSQWSDNEAVTLNMTLFNRQPLHPEVQRVLGEFTNNTLLDFDHMDRPFLAQVQAAQERLLEHIEHSLVEGVDLLRQLARQRHDFSGSLMPVVFTSLLLGESGTSFADLGWREVYGLSQTPQVTFDHQLREERDRLLFNWDLAESALDVPAMRCMLERYLDALRTLCRDQRAWQRRVDREPPPAQAALRARINAMDTRCDDAARTLIEPFLRQTQRHPGRTAVTDADNRTLSYAALLDWSLALAASLRQASVCLGDRVLIQLPKGAGQIASVLACHLCGAVYVPVSMDTPPGRLQALIVQAQPKALMQSSGAPAIQPGLPRIDAGAPTAAPSDTPMTAAPIHGDHAAYILFTSGSTGTPKGVEMTHNAVRNTLDDMRQRFGGDGDDRVFALSALNFDLSVYDLFAPLAWGGGIVMPSEGSERDPEHWHRQLHTHGVTIWNSVPALLDMLVTWCEAQQATLPEHLRLVLLSGDWIPLELPGRLRKLAPNARIIALGGATEAAIWSNWQDATEVPDDWPSIPYGRPLSRQCYRVLDRYFHDRPDQVAGDLHIGGAGLARGYWRDPTRTAEAFFTHPRDGQRLYRTGDRARYWPDGTLEFLGRLDHQVKIGGHRIELGEIEAVLKTHPQVRQAAVTVQSRPGQKMLVGYIVADASDGLDQALKEYLAYRLPPYMVPRHLVPLATLPLSANGKIDRQALPPVQPTATPAQPITEHQQILLEVLRECTGLPTLALDDNFFEAGATSVKLVLAHGQLQQRLKRTFPVTHLFAFPCLRALEQALGRDGADNLPAHRQRRARGQHLTF
ncbi:non-ribosomal peptide synthetase [Solilutibacter pythonis]|uniref:non-ribosomal peptide synthetase n=1 Tax=Solilutibacter pythonis TaxID=2483112 RepID=UPI001313E2BC|nr:non-ribosomal peptide synthetase [Lysobacter pythonis]